MKKSLILATSFAMALGVGVAVGAHHMKEVAKKADAAAHTFYFNLNGQSNLKQGNERYAAYHWKDGGTNAWDSLTSAGGDFYSGTLDPSVHDRIILARMNGAVAENNWANRWDQSGDLEYSASTVYFRATSESTDGSFTAEAYTPVYGLVGSFAGSSWATDVPMAINGLEATVTKVLEAGDQIKVRADNAWAVNYGYSALDNASKELFNDASDNASAKAAGSYTFTLNFATGVLSAELNSVKHTVNVYVDGVLRGAEQVSDGALPVAPATTFMESFSGWYTDDDYKTEVLSITSDTSVYGKVEARATNTYKYDVSRVDEGFEKVYLYAFDETGHNAEFPGVEVEEETIAVPVGATFVLSGGEDKPQTEDIAQLATPIANDTLRVLAATDGSGHHKTLWESELEAEDGYYVVGTRSSWTFEGATKLGAGDEENEAKLIQYHALKDEAFKVKKYIDGETTWFAINGDPSDEGNYVADKEKDVNIYASKDGKLYVEDYSEPDVPDEDGYYICGIGGSFRFEDAVKMTETTAGGNVAYYSGLVAAVDDEIRVRSYFNPRLDPQEDVDQWATLGTHDVNYGELHNNNFKFSKAGSYDIYAKYEDGFKFFVAEHVDNFTIEMTAVKFNGKVSEGIEAMASQLAYITADFEPQNLAKSGYVMNGVYEEQTLETLYTPRKFAANGHLYVKYMKVGFYALSEAGEYKLENADPMMTEGIAETNKAEVLLTVKANDCYSFVEYKADGTMAGQSGLGDGIPAGLATYESDEFGGHV